MLPLTDLRPGDTLGRYEILLPVARGGMANVWAARLTGSRGFTRLVAIKTMLPGMTDDPDFEAMFLDEARLASRIRHPHVVEIIDLGDQDEWVYIVMEWVNGETMFTINKRAKAKAGIPLPILLRIGSSACAGLHAAHELRDDKGKLVDLVHRDVSPQNVMVSFDGIVKLVDFGVAKAAGRMHETRVAGIMKGKVPYLSPEQLMGQKVDRRADLFSLGVLLYVMVSGRHPFRGETDAKTMENICTRAPVPLRQLVPDVRPDLEAVVMRALEKDRTHRWPDGAEMQRALDHVLAAMSASVTDGDVAAFVRDVLGDVLDERSRGLDEAIRALDAKGRPDADLHQRTRLSAKRAVKGGAPLPATFEGILPVALDVEPVAPPSMRALPAVSARAPSFSYLPPASGAPSSVFNPTGRRRSPWPWVAGTAALALVAGGGAMRLGLAPAITSQLPPWMAAVLAPPADVPVPPPPGSVPRPAPPSPPSAPPAPTTSASPPAATTAPPSASTSSAVPPRVKEESPYDSPPRPPAGGGRKKPPATAAPAAPSPPEPATPPPAPPPAPAPPPKPAPEAPTAKPFTPDQL